jgi:hypothetical protein
MNPTKKLIELKLYRNPTKNSWFHVKFMFYQVYSGVHVKFKFYQVFTGVPVKFKFYQVFSAVH